MQVVHHNIRLILYGTDGCHLCEHARELLAPVVADGRVTLDAVDILDDPRLEHRYGTSIPVIREDARDAELAWPFDRRQLEEFLARLSTR